MADTLAPYACDECRSRKLKCSRDPAGCQRCKLGQNVCSYSRSGVIRRNRKRKLDQAVGESRTATAESDGLQPQLATDIDSTRERLEAIADKEHQSLAALSSLSDTYTAVWQDSAAFNKMSNNGDHRFFLFENHANEWVDVFIATIERGQPLFTPAPPEVLDHLRMCRPHLVQDRAWLVLFYGVILSMVCSNNPSDERMKTRLKCNLWLALNDVRLLLEPSDLKIGALILLAVHVEEFTTPSLCWMLVTNACRMLQALGITNRRLDPPSRQRRNLLFWNLNILDKSMALVFCRPPTFSQAITREMTLPTMSQLLSFQPHRSSRDVPALFGAHYMYHMYLLSRVMGDAWYCLYEQDHDIRSINAVRESLDSWHGRATEVLEAAALSEKPFLDTNGAISIDLGLNTVLFSYYYNSVLLTRSSPQLRLQCIDTSERMLILLDKMVSDSQEPYNGVVWQLICCPFTPYLILFREILSKGKDPDTAQKKRALAAMEHMPTFLDRMSSRNSLAAKLKNIATVFIQHARSIVSRQENEVNETSNNQSQALDRGCRQANHNNELQWDSDLSMRPPDLGTATWGLNDLGDFADLNGDSWTWANDTFVDSMLDTLIWDRPPGFA